MTKMGKLFKKKFFYYLAVVLSVALLAFSLAMMCSGRCGLASKDRVKLPAGGFKGCNLIMISINNVGASHMSLYGYNRKTTPKLDKWARGALVFDNFFSPASWTLPAATSLFTSLYPYTHKVMDRYHGNLLDKHIRTLPEILRENNYKTAAFTGGLDYAKLFGHMLGFEYVSDNPNFSGFETTLPQAKEWLARNSQEKFFLFIHGYDAHPPFTPPERFKGVFSSTKGRQITVDTRVCLRGYRNSNNQYIAFYTPQGDLTKFKDMNPPPPQFMRPVIITQADIDYLRDLYDEEVLSVDSLVADFLNSLDKKMLNNTIIVIFSEHGEMFARHGRFGRAGTIRGNLYDDVLRVPLIMRVPRGKGGRISGLAQIIDVVPTLLDILGVAPLKKAQGKNLLPLINNNTSVNEYVYAGAEYNFGRPQPFSAYDVQSLNESIRNDKWKLIREVKFPNNKQPKRSEEILELYDLRNDPEELFDLIQSRPDVRDSLKRNLSVWAKWAKGFVPFVSSDVEISADLVRDAREHGYW